MPPDPPLLHTWYRRNDRSGKIFYFFRQIYQQFRLLLELTQTLERPDFNSSGGFISNFVYFSSSHRLSSDFCSSYFSSGTGVFCFCSRWANYSARAPGSRHIQPRAMLHVPPARYELTLVSHGLSKESSGFTLSVYFIYNFLLRPLTKN